MLEDKLFEADLLEADQAAGMPEAALECANMMAMLSINSRQISAECKSRHRMTALQWHGRLML